VIRTLRSLALLLVVAAPALRAQVGTMPDKSPFLDLNDGQRLGIGIGWLSTAKDVAGVGPKGNVPMANLRYDLYLGGPMYFSGTLGVANTKRDVLDYARKSAQRLVGSRNVTLVDANASLALSVIGPRSWKGIQPLILGGVGYVAGFGDTQTDASGFRFGAKFDLSYGLAVRWTTKRAGELRADLGWKAWQLRYPETYHSTEGDATPIVPVKTSLSPWQLNRVVSIGWTWAAFR
jgi:hypothetical protein